MLYAAIRKSTSNRCDKCFALRLPRLLRVPTLRATDAALAVRRNASVKAETLELLVGRGRLPAPVSFTPVKFPVKFPEPFPQGRVQLAYSSRDDSVPPVALARYLP